MGDPRIFRNASFMCCVTGKALSGLKSFIFDKTKTLLFILDRESLEKKNRNRDRRLRKKGKLLEAFSSSFG